jgi:glycine cleavage system H protein
MSDIRFTESHEWVRADGDEAVIGITDFAQRQLGDVIFVELPEVGRRVEQGRDAAVVESVKAASEVFAPLDGAVTEINPALTGDPALVNTAPEGEGWFFKMSLSNRGQLEGLMDRAAYGDFVAGLS